MVKFTLPRVVAVLLYKEGRDYIAHALDFDICAVGRSEEKAIDKLRRNTKKLIEFALENDWEASIVSPAPAEFWQWAETAEYSSRRISPIIIEPKKESRTTAQVPDPDFPKILMAFLSHASRQGYRASH